MQQTEYRTKQKNVRMKVNCNVERSYYTKRRCTFKCNIMKTNETGNLQQCDTVRNF